MKTTDLFSTLENNILRNSLDSTTKDKLLSNLSLLRKASLNILIHRFHRLWEKLHHKRPI